MIFSEFKEYYKTQQSWYEKTQFCVSATSAITDQVHMASVQAFSEDF
jgi:hypothetical protein